MIPERVYAITCATYDKKKKKKFNTDFGLYTYRDVPRQVFSQAVNIVSQDGYTYKIATKEKALCDKLYVAPLLKNMTEIREYLFDDLRVNEILLDTFDSDIVNELSELYHSRNVSLFAKMLTKGKLYD